MANTYISRTFGTPTNSAIWTLSFWIKRSSLSPSTSQKTFSAGTGSTDRTEISFAGGNDGLNTIIPLNQYDTYANLRPKIKQSITAGNPNKAIELDSTLALEDQVYLHPEFIDFKDLYDQGKLNIIHGVGYPVVNKSHFASRALMFKGGDGTPENSNKDDALNTSFL